MYIVRARPYYSADQNAKRQVRAAYHQSALLTGSRVDDITVVLNEWPSVKPWFHVKIKLF